MTATTGHQAPGRLDFDDPVFQTDPWPLYAHHREHDPVHWSPALGSFFVFGHEHVRQTLVSPDFGTYHPFRASRRAFGPSMLDSDGARHTVQRAAAAGSFRPRQVGEAATRIVAPLAAALLDDLLPAGRADFAEVLARTLPMQVVCRVMGLPVADAQWLGDMMRPLAAYVDHAGVELAEVVRRRQELRAYLLDAAADGAEHPGLLHVLAGNEELTEADACNNGILLLAAGTETTTAAITNLVARVAAEPGLFERLRRDRSLLPAVIAETLRHEPPLHVTLRFAQRDLVLEGVDVPAGSAVQVCLASANRDPAVHPEPDRWLPDRPRRPTMSFGMGRHLCLGMGLANAELETVLGAVLDRLDHLALAEGVDPRPVGRTFRTVPALRCSYPAPRPAPSSERRTAS
ncbi:cytochrome P450 [Kitasatospora phosalacinea]|uniref:Cytochrome P450 n=1 Tax=Kitasatospora phosalacinea TaxID=2065 RepID=A0A9W6PHI7_9ACTN|nr:cytochrome P450 [Kitasatospora phosalacinea]GLW55054.1 cytochrome P450 [Kitasatospora phosalacinea]